MAEKFPLEITYPEGETERFFGHPENEGFLDALEDGVRRLMESTGLAHLPGVMGVFTSNPDHLALASTVAVPAGLAWSRLGFQKTEEKLGMDTGLALLLALNDLNAANTALREYRRKLGTVPTEIPEGAPFLFTAVKTTI